MQVLRNYPYMQRFLESCAAENVSEALVATGDRRISGRFRKLTVAVGFRYAIGTGLIN